MIARCANRVSAISWLIIFIDFHILTLHVRNLLQFYALKISVWCNSDRILGNLKTVNFWRELQSYKLNKYTREEFRKQYNVMVQISMSWKISIFFADVILVWPHLEINKTDLKICKMHPFENDGNWQQHYLKTKVTVVQTFFFSLSQEIRTKSPFFFGFHLSPFVCFFSTSWLQNFIALLVTQTTHNYLSKLLLSSSYQVAN